MIIQFKNVLPTGFESASLLVLSVAIVALGNTRSLLEYYSLDSSNEVIHNTAGSAIGAGLARIDSLDMTAQVVTFLIWAVIGLFCLSFIQIIGRIYRGLELDEQLSSNKYIHPATFARAKFWQRVLLDFLATVVCVGLIGLVAYLFLAYGLPAGLAYTRLFLLGVSATRIGAFVLGFALLYAWLLVFCILFKLLVHRRKIFAKS